MTLDDKIQRTHDRYYKKHGPCCAGCDHWRWRNSKAGECTRTAPVSGKERLNMIGVFGASMEFGAGHIMTLHDHVCGEFIDTYDWGSHGSL